MCNFRLPGWVETYSHLSQGYLSPSCFFLICKFRLHVYSFYVALGSLGGWQCIRIYYRDISHHHVYFLYETLDGFAGLQHICIDHKDISLLHVYSLYVALDFFDGLQPTQAV